MKKRILATILAVAMVLSVCTITSAEYETAVGSEEAPTGYNDYGFDLSAEGVDRYQSATLVDGVYEIANAGQMYWFANLVETSDDKAINGKLVDDIDLGTEIPEGLVWKPIASTSIEAPTASGVINDDAYYTGVFDGNGKTISNLNMTAYPMQQRMSVGLFGTVGETGVVKNLYVDGFVKTGIVVSGSQGDGRYGAIAGCVLNDGTVKDCMAVNSTITITSGDTVAGIATGANLGGTIENVIVLDCTITGGSWSRLGMVAGENKNDTNAADFTGTLKNVYTDGNVTSNYTGNQEGNVEGNVSDDRLASGEIAYKLNAGREENVWGQELGVDTLPVLKGMKVYQVSDTEYSNDESDVPVVEPTEEPIAPTAALAPTTGVTSTATPSVTETTTPTSAPSATPTQVTTVEPTEETIAPTATLAPTTGVTPTATPSATETTTPTSTPSATPTPVITVEPTAVPGDVYAADSVVDMRDAIAILLYENGLLSATNDKINVINGYVASKDNDVNKDDAEKILDCIVGKNKSLVVAEPTAIANQVGQEVNATPVADATPTPEYDGLLVSVGDDGKVTCASGDKSVKVPVNVSNVLKSKSAIYGGFLKIKYSKNLHLAETGVDNLLGDNWIVKYNPIEDANATENVVVVAFSSAYPLNVSRTLFNLNFDINENPTIAEDKIVSEIKLENVTFYTYAEATSEISRIEKLGWTDGKVQIVEKVPVKKVKSIKFTKKSVKIKRGKKATLKVKIKGAKKAKFTTSKKKVVKIVKKKAKKIVIKGVRKGKAVITAKAAGKKAKCKVTVR